MENWAKAKNVFIFDCLQFRGEDNPITQKMKSPLVINIYRW